MLNPPERIVQNILTAPNRMQKVDDWLGSGRLLEFSSKLANLLVHAEMLPTSLSGSTQDSSTAAEISFRIIEAATELETGWNAVRLSNVPASIRQGRVAFECIAAAILLALPLSKLKELPAKTNHLLKNLQRNPTSTVSDWLNYTVEIRNDLPTAIPPMKATEVFASFLDIAERLLKMEPEWVNGIREYRNSIQHPASHGSADLYMYHFEHTEATMTAGAVLAKSRAPTLQGAADELMKLTDLLLFLLNYATDLMRR